ncbi:hypothetical protein MKX03_034408 [Papaver bracteatum]|nr:hypothetical protein MKX03_034408 [Papaver bracteatum]
MSQEKEETVRRKSENATFSKITKGSLKKARELSVLCEAEVALIVFSPKGKLSEFSSSSTSMQDTIERYQNYNKDEQDNHSSNNKAIEQQNSQQLKYEVANLTKKIRNLEASKRKLMGEGLESCSIDELETAENQAENSLLNIRAKKNQLYGKDIEQLKQKEKQLLEENEVLCDRFMTIYLPFCPNSVGPWGSRQRKQQNQQRKITPYETGSNSHEVESDLKIFRPEGR